MANARIDQAFLQKAKRNPGLYWDTAIKGFGVRVGANQRPVSYLFQKSGGRRVTLGAVDHLELNEARAKAKRLDAAHLEAGPTGRPITISEGLDTHLQSMEARECSQASIILMRDEVNRLAVDLLNRRLDRIDHSTLVQLHVKVTKESGPYVANRVIRHIRTVYGTANVPWPMSPRWRKNPENKEGKEPVRDLTEFGAVVRRLDNPNLSDWWRFALITGLRRTDALSIRWREIDARRSGWLFRPCPKGGPRRAFDLPITTHMRTIFERQAVESEWVFTGNVRREHLKEPRKPGLPTPHRLRATWATRAAELGCPVPVMAALLNHSVKSQNITLRYATPSDASLSEWAQRVADSLWTDIHSNSPKEQTDA